MPITSRIVTGLLLALPATGALAAQADPPAAATSEPVFLALASAPVKSTSHDAPMQPGNALLATSLAPIGTQTVAEREPDGHLQIRCNEVSIGDLRGNPRRLEQQP
jgi:streptogramin lyase